MSYLYFIDEETLSRKLNIPESRRIGQEILSKAIIVGNNPCIIIWNHTAC